MKLSNFLTLKALVAFVFALGALLAPVYLVVLHGHQLDDFGTVLARYYGALLLGIGWLCWSVKNRLAKSDLRQDVLTALLVADSLGFVIALAAQYSVNMGVLGWVDTAIWLILVLGLVYFRFVEPSSD
jgi:hypothetical protein